MLAQLQGDGMSSFKDALSCFYRVQGEMILSHAVSSYTAPQWGFFQSRCCLTQRKVVELYNCWNYSRSPGVNFLVSLDAGELFCVQDIQSQCLPYSCPHSASQSLLSAALNGVQRGYCRTGQWLWTGGESLRTPGGQVDNHRGHLQLTEWIKQSKLCQSL